ncbi:hypothetical protein LTR10_022307 [Elasticomyces elasticus]|uniref:Uncharacterized protein n=1 Tax=Exophiala sideris TaxID=1016849 RepID=A0ABR0J6P4_9EURO|nr:hypothetical protein LTR10_022307 [Elasticomyces elasticus]KAK5028783.1 hypothetical protein LTS07_006162 [Exophiala sideris]KAK5035652.1 hypothetical protein LTR13_005781 [Exophiala sideris]KAK5057287.1 hypothetical protein LTR69_007326 [Exophiala sideris]KAK5181740.1 hypothetical protein LTR44_005940 [Eurotiomycetes sp. CCFEE 6388]
MHLTLSPLPSLKLPTHIKMDNFSYDPIEVDDAEVLKLNADLSKLSLVDGKKRSYDDALGPDSSTTSARPSKFRVVVPPTQEYQMTDLEWAISSRSMVWTRSGDPIDADDIHYFIDAGFSLTCTPPNIDNRERAGNFTEAKKRVSFNEQVQRRCYEANSPPKSVAGTSCTAIKLDDNKDWRIWRCLLRLRRAREARSAAIKQHFSLHAV